MSKTLLELSTPEDFEDLLDASASSPVIIYKHSLTCGTSGVAFEEIRDLLPGLPDAVRIGMVQVQRARPLSNLIASRLGLRHETPQVLIVHEGRVIWHASHFRVTADQIAAAIARLGHPGGAATA